MLSDIIIVEGKRVNNQLKFSLPPVSKQLAYRLGNKK